MPPKTLPSTGVCSPSAVKNQKTFSCFNYEMLVLLARLYNDARSHDADKIAIPVRKNKKQLWKALHDKMKPVCGSDETCWIKQDFVQYSPHAQVKSSLEKRFKPKKPESWQNNPREWLNTYDILNVMKQYEESDASFHFVGVFPVDFAAKNSSSGYCIVQEMCQLNLQDVWNRGIRKVGVVFNLDRHDQSGSHWTSLFIGLDPKKKNFGVFYYDSVASSPPHEIATFMKARKLELEELHVKHRHKVRYEVNRVRRQYKGTECGVFSILFQIMMLTHSFEDVCKNMGYDDDVVQFRNILYR